jgi:hypothetical protein
LTTEFWEYDRDTLEKGAGFSHAYFERAAITTRQDAGERPSRLQMRAHRAMQKYAVAVVRLA